MVRAIHFAELAGVELSNGGDQEGVVSDEGDC